MANALCQQLYRPDGLVNQELISPSVLGNVLEYRGTLQSTGRIVTIKRLRFASEHTNELSIWPLLDHKNIRPFLGIIMEGDNTISTVAECIGGGNAFDYVKRPGVDPAPLLRGLANGMHYLHTHLSGPIFHGDIRGENVLIGTNGSALLNNFDCAFRFGVTPPSSRLVGSLRWMAPECIDSREVTAERDIWAFGMTVLELFTAQPPFPNLTTGTEIMLRILAEPPERSALIPDQWWELSDTCWKEAALRPSALALRTRIVNFSCDECVVDNGSTTG